MLLQLVIKNIAIADNIDIDWQPGMTSISGETGAGKSILLNSLNLALGERADSGIVRHGEKRAEVVAVFNVSRIKKATKWLAERDLENAEECILRRVISAEGRSRAFINGQPVPLAELKALGEFLIDIHSQHAHQSLMRTDTHLTLLDDYINNPELMNKVKTTWIHWQGLEKKWRSLQSDAEEKAARIQLLQYQHQELDELALVPQEVEQLDAEFQRHQSREALLHGAHCATREINNEQSSIHESLQKALGHLQGLKDDSDILQSAIGLLDSACIQLAECESDIQRYIESFEVDEEHAHFVESRLNTVHELARKHQVPSEQLFELADSLKNELDALQNNEASLAELENETQQAKALFVKRASQLSELRRKKAKHFEKEIIEKLEQLAMPGARFKVELNQSTNGTALGCDDIEFQISLNAGQPLQPIGKVASGGELSRVSLAIQVVCAEHSTIPTLVFDEVDVGVSGATAEIVGHMLRSVGQRGQVICVTHLPQVAALGHHHCIVAKQQHTHKTTTQIAQLDQSERVTEIARMLGGIDITAQTRAHAEEMLNQHRRAH